MLQKRSPTRHGLPTRVPVDPRFMVMILPEQLKALVLLMLQSSHHLSSPTSNNQLVVHWRRYLLLLLLLLEPGVMGIFVRINQQWPLPARQ